MREPPLKTVRPPPGCAAGPGRAFLAGLLAPSAASLVGAALTALTILLAGSLYLTPERFAALAVARGWDHAASHTTAFTVRSLALRKATPRRSDLVLVGASDLRAAVESPDALARAIEAAGGRRPRVHDLALAGVSFYTAFGAIESLPDGFDGVLVLATSVERLAAGRKQMHAAYRYELPGFTCLLIDDEARRLGVDVPFRCGFWFVDHWPFVRSQWERLKAHDRMRLHEYVGRGRWSERHRREVEADLAQDLTSDRWEENLRALDTAIRRTRRRADPRLVLLEGPRDPVWSEGWYPPDLRSRYGKTIRRFAAAEGALYLDLAAEAGLEPSDFADYCHVNVPAARSRYTRVLGAHLAPLFTPGGHGR
jgi:hypothetical protein